MAKVSVNKLKAAMVTLSEITDTSGHPLIRANEELTDKNITLLKMWGVVEVDVKHSKQEVDINELLIDHPPNLIKHAIDLAAEKFKFFDEDDSITHLLKKYFIENKLNGADK